MSKSRAFTLVEMLVAISVAVILLSLVFTAIHAARESSRRIACVNNLKQIGLGLQNYESTHKKLPRACGDAGNGPLLAILPYVGYSTIYDSIDFESAIYMDQQLMNTFVALYRCPATLWPEAPRTDYVLNRGTTLAEKRDSPWLFEERAFARTSSFSNGASGTALLAETCPRLEGQSKGSMFFLPRRHILHEQDSINFCSECRSAGGGTPLSTISNGRSWIGEGIANYYHLFPPNDRSCSNEGLIQSSLYTTISMHSAGVNLAFADGHIDFVSNHIDQETWLRIGKR